MTTRFSEGSDILDETPVYASSANGRAKRPTEPNVSDVLDELERYLALLGENVERASITFGAVLVPEGPMMGEKSLDTATEPEVSGLNHRLRRITRELRASSDRLNGIISRVDL